MKKITLLLFVMLFSSFIYAANWGFWDATRSFVTIGGTEYTLWNSGAGSFQGKTFNVNLGDGLALSSIYANTWRSSGGDVTGIVYYYTIYSGARPSTPTFNSLTCGWLFGDSSDQKWGNTGLNVNLVQGLGVGSYTLEIYGKLSGTGDPNGDIYDNNNNNVSNYTAVISISPSTTIEKLESTLKLSGANGKVCATFDGSAKVDLYSSSGQLMRSVNTENVFSEKVKAGLYLLRINGKTHKIVVN